MSSLRLTMQLGRILSPNFVLLFFLFSPLSFFLLLSLSPTLLPGVFVRVCLHLLGPLIIADVEISAQTLPPFLKGELTPCARIFLCDHAWWAPHEKLQVNIRFSFR